MRPTLTVIADPADRWMMRAACIGQAPAYDESASRLGAAQGAGSLPDRVPGDRGVPRVGPPDQVHRYRRRREVPLRPPPWPPRPAGTPPDSSVEEQQAS